jgi:FdhD protein
MSTIENAQKGENAVDMPPPGPDPSPPGDTVTVSLRSVEAGTVVERTDEVATEEPLEVRVLAGEGPERRHSIAVTMRTPGHDRELAAGFLFTEGILTRPDQVRDIAHCAPGRPNSGNIVNVALAPGTPFDASRLSRNVYTTSSCGICGKTSLDMVRAVLPGPVSGEFRLEERAVLELSRRLRRSQILFSRTGGLHAAALFDALGALLRVREDVGRHNAVDKIVGEAFLAGDLPLAERILLVSGRASFEIVQKAGVAGIPVVAAVSAPSSLAVDLAERMGQTVVGFVRDGRFNVYSHPERIALT